MTAPPRLGTIEATDALLRDLYIDLRAAVHRWSRVTHQTSQVRMGYVGQHLASVVTGYRGSHSGARGQDLILPDGMHAEVKTCSRVDQLGNCGACGLAIPSLSASCAACGSADIVRKDDSKWLLSVPPASTLGRLFEPRWYYFILFDHDDVTLAEVVNIRIYRVDPRCHGFSYCMVDYFRNIRANSRSGAAFNLWPFSLKFALMRPELIYHARIDRADDIETLVFEGQRGDTTLFPLAPLTDYHSSTTLTIERIGRLADQLGLPRPRGARKRDNLDALETCRRRDGIADARLTDALCEAIYRDRIASASDLLPPDR